MTFTQREQEAHAVLRRLAGQHPSSPFLALGQTVFWDEPVKAALVQLLDNAQLGGEVVAGVHDTDYFAKTRVRRAGPGRFALLPHNDGATRDLWSAAGEVSALFGSETFPRRHDFMRCGVPFDRLARNHPDGRYSFQDSATEAWGWRGLVYTGSRDIIVSRLPLRDVGEGILSMLAWGFENTLQQIAPDCCCNEATRFAETVTGWCREYCAAHPDLFLTDLFQHVLPQIYALLLGREPQNLTVSGTASLLRFSPQTCMLPRFEFVDLFLQPSTNELARGAYNAAVAGSTIYTLDKFGAGALPFDVIVPERGRGTLRVTPRVVFVETPQPIAIGLKQPVGSISDLADVLSSKLGDQITLVGKAVTLVAMLAREFIFVFNEEGSLYVSHTREMVDSLTSQGIPLNLKPILRMQYETWDALSVGQSTLRLPQHLAATFGRATITAPEFAESWRSVIEEQRALCSVMAGLRKPRELLRYLHGRLPLGSWDEKLTRYNSLKVELKELQNEVQNLHALLRREYVEQRELRLRRRTVQEAMGEHFRRTRATSPEAKEERESFRAQLAGIDAGIRANRRLILSLKHDVRAAEKCESAQAARAALDEIERAAETARFDIVRNALLTIHGLPHTNHRPSAWWLPMVDSCGEWFRRIVSTTRLYIEPLHSQHD